MTDTPIHTLDHLDGAIVCSCGGCKKAIDDALAEMQAINSTQCMQWFMAKALAYSTIAQIVMQGSDPAHQVEARVDRLVTLMASEKSLDYITQQIIVIVEAGRAVKQ